MHQHLSLAAMPELLHMQSNEKSFLSNSQYNRQVWLTSCVLKVGTETKLTRRALQ